MKNVLLSIAYIGTAYAGWQVQKNTPTVQSVLQSAIEEAIGAKTSLTGCSRTDSGVHAELFCASAVIPDYANAIPTEKLPTVINRFLPPDIAVTGALDVALDFHPRYQNLGKEYKYLIWNDAERNPFYEGRSLYYPKPLDAGIMNDAAKCFIGKHDFASFMAAGSKITDTVREIFDASVKRDGKLVEFTVSGDGFLYNMVRIMTGTLIGVSEGKFQPCDIPDIIEAKRRNAAGTTVLPCGLYLSRVFYDLPGFERFRNENINTVIL